MSNNVMKDGFAYSAIKHIEHRVENGLNVAYMKRGDLDGTFSLDDVDAFFDQTYGTLDLWDSEIFRFYKITMHQDPEKWMDSTCTCPAFASRFICKHITCIAYYLKLISKPKRTLITANQPKGRPKTASKALVID